MNHRKLIYVCIICVFVDVHRCQFSHTHPNLKHSRLSDILAYFLTYTSTQSGRHKWMTLKTIFCILRKTADITKYDNEV